MSRKRRLLPWREKLTSNACTGFADDPHLPVAYARLERNPEALYEWTCPDCEMSGPESWWDHGVPIPPHEFVKSPTDRCRVALKWQCRVCLQAADDQGFHPKPAVGPFDPARVKDATTVDALGGWSVAIDDSLGFMEAYVDRATQVIVLASETWQVVDGDTAAYGRLLGMQGRRWRTTAAGMYFLGGMPDFDAAQVAFRSGRDEDVVRAKDEITQLSELLESLATQAVSVGYDGALEQRQILTGRYLQARARVGALEARLNTLQGQFDTVAMAIIG